MKKKIACLVLAAVFALSISAASAEYTPGEYQASAQGFGGEVKVTMTFDASAITAVAAEGTSETAGIGSNAIDKLPDAILAA